MAFDDLLGEGRKPKYKPATDIIDELNQDEGFEAEEPDWGPATGCSHDCDSCNKHAFIKLLTYCKVYGLC